MTSRIVVFLAAVAAFGQTPNVAENGVLNSASYVTSGQSGHAVSPGALVSIFGSELAAGLSTASSVPLSTSIENVSVSFNDTPAPLLFVSPGQINAQLPSSMLSGTQETGVATVVVTRGGNRSQPRQVQIARFSPGVYTLNSTGTGGALSVNASDGSLTQAAGAVPGLNSRPARAGEAIILYVSGLGPVDIPIADGAASGSTLRRTTTQPVVLIGGREAQVIFSGLAPEFPAVNQVNVIIPAGVTAGNEVPVQVRIGGITTSDRVTIAIQN